MNGRSEEYRRRAAEAEESARKAKDPTARATLEEIARGWLALAEQVERNRFTGDPP